MATNSAPKIAAPDSPLRLLPKVELHCHVEGTARVQTVAELAAHHGIDIGVADPADLYEYESLADFLAAFGTVCSVLLEPNDFHRLAYEAAEDGAKAGITYREMFFSPGFHLDRGVPFETMWQGLVAGVRRGRSRLRCTYPGSSWISTSPRASDQRWACSKSHVVLIAIC